MKILKKTEQRISWAFDNFGRIGISLSGGKDSTAMMHLVGAEARRRHRKVRGLFLDAEVNYQCLINHMLGLKREYADVLELDWVCEVWRATDALSLNKSWYTWDPSCPGSWVHQKPDWAKGGSHFEFFIPGMEISKFKNLYNIACTDIMLIGIRADESLNRRNAVWGNNIIRYDDTIGTSCGAGAVKYYPLYDWSTDDVFAFLTDKSYCSAYDRMYMAGVPISKMRLCQPFGDEQRQSLNLWAQVEPETWCAVQQRIPGAGMDARYFTAAFSLPEGFVDWKAYYFFLGGTKECPEETYLLLCQDLLKSRKEGWHGKTRKNKKMETYNEIISGRKPRP